MGILLLFVVSHVVVKMAQCFAANTVSRFRSPKTGEEELKCNRYEERSLEGFSFLNASSFTNCDVKIFVNEKKK